MTEKPKKAKYKTTNWGRYNAALKARGSLLVWFDKNMDGLEKPNRRRGRNERFSDAAIQFCLSIKSLLVNSTGIKMLGEGEWKRKSTAQSTVANGAKFTWALVPKRWKYER